MELQNSRQDPLKKYSFISLYQERVQQNTEDSSLVNTRLGTQTKTDSREQSDPDITNLSTQTQTRGKESADSDNSCVKYFLIPR
jgi:hypothetical protein